MQSKLTSAGGSPEWRPIQDKPKRSSHPLQQKLGKSALLLALVAGVTSAAFAQTAFTPGILKDEIWFPSDQSTGQSALDGWLTTAMAGTPQMTLWWNSYGPFNTGNNQGDHYGQVVSGYVIPPATGNYEFYIRSDDPSELFISTDATPAHLGTTPIADQSGCCNAFTSTEDGTLSSTPIALTAGQKYYIRAMHVEGGGGDYVQVGWRTPNDTSLTNPPTAQIPAAYIGADCPTNGASVNITTPPASITVSEGSSATFTVAYTQQWNSTVVKSTNQLDNIPAGWPPTYALVTSPQSQDANAVTDASIVWFENGKPFEMESTATLTLPLVTMADNGAKITVQVSVPGAYQVSSAATITVNKKTTAPTIAHVIGNPNLSAISVKFDSAMDPTTAGTAANYTLTPSVAVSSAALDSSDPTHHTVILSTASQTLATQYTLNVSNVKDVSGNAIAANSSIKFYSAVLATGACSEAYWSNLGDIPSLLTDPRYPGSPTYTAILSDWEYPPYNGPFVAPAQNNNEAGDNYDNIITGWFVPPKTGNYVFFTCSDDPSNLYLSTDSTPANKKLIAQETNWSNPRQWQTSAGGTDVTAKRSDQFASTEWPGGNTITLTAGKQYYMESQHHEGGGGDNVDCTYKMDTDPDPADGSASTLTGAVIATTIPADGIFTGTSPGDGSTTADPENLSVSYTAGISKIDNTTVTLKIDGNPVTPTITTNGSAATISYKFSPWLAAASKHTGEFDYPLADGTTGSYKWQFQVVNYFTITPDMAVKPDTTQPGFIWNMSQVDAIGSDSQNSLQRTTDQLAGLLGPNTADPNAIGAASGKGVPNSNPNLPIVFKIPTVINLSKDNQNTGPFGNFTPDLQMPGSPGTGGGTDNQAAEIDTFLTLPAGLVRMGVNSDDDFETYAGAIGSVTNLLGNFEGGRGAADTLYLFQVQQAGTYPFRTLWENGGGDSNIEWFSLINGKHVLLNDSTNGGFPAYQVATAAPAQGASFTGFTLSADHKSVVLTYTGTLQSADTVNGPYTPVSNSPSPATIPIATTGNKFYRVQ
jgi:hypothetical protein